MVKYFTHSLWGIFTILTFWMGTIFAPKLDVTSKYKNQNSSKNESLDNNGASLVLMKNTVAFTQSLMWFSSLWCAM